MILPALSVAVQFTVCEPTELVSTAPQLEEATPDVASLAFGDAVALPLSTTGLGETEGANVGAVASRLIVKEAAFVLRPALLVHDPLKVAPAVSDV